MIHLLLQQAAPAASGGVATPGFLFSILPYIAIFGIFYFLLIRPQTRRIKEQRQMIDAVQRGDQVVTGGGIVCKVTKVDDEQVEVEIAQGVRVRVVKATLTGVTSATTPKPAND